MCGRKQTESPNGSQIISQTTRELLKALSAIHRLLHKENEVERAVKSLNKMEEPGDPTKLTTNSWNLQENSFSNNMQKLSTMR